jgi:hypothetical protein
MKEIEVAALVQARQELSKYSLSRHRFLEVDPICYVDYFLR